jgi:carnosine N-methyltransferase
MKVLAIELKKVVSRGFTCQGNEYSLYMLMASNFILNHVRQPLSFSIYPWMHQFSNMPSRDAQTHQILIPDVLVISGVPQTADFSMVAGDFNEVYRDPEQLGAWDCIITCFFLDTNKNMFDYAKSIHDTLKGMKTRI